MAPLLDQRLASWEIEPDALAAYLIFGFISAPQTIVKQIKKLPPAHYLVWRAGDVKVQRYWSFDQSEKIVCSYDEALDLLRAKLDESIRLRLRSDVPVGLLLSGGLDSNTLLARLVRGIGQKVKAFTIGFTQREYDESEIACTSARHFGVEHHLLVGDPDLLKLLPDVVRHYGEPSADKSVLPTMLLCGLTSRYVKVALSGDGGDEAFAGYPKHWLKSWQHHVSGLFPSGWRERWTLDSMKGGLWQQTKIMEKLRRRLLPETPQPVFGRILLRSFFSIDRHADVSKTNCLVPWRLGARVLERQTKRIRPNSSLGQHRATAVFAADQARHCQHGTQP